MSSNTAQILTRAVFILTAALALALLWLLFDVILVVMGAVLIATLLRLVAEPFVRFGRLREVTALLPATAIVVGIVAVVAYLFGSRIAAEFQDLLQHLDAAQHSMVTAMQASPLGETVMSHAVGANLSITAIFTRIFQISAAFIEAVIVTFIGGVYLAAQPALYRDGLTKLVPRQWRANAAETIDDIGNALRLWLLGQLIQMLLIGAMATGAVWFIGLPSPLALGLIAGLLEFVPYLGPIIAAIPALLVAATQNLHAIIWTGVAYIVIHQIEGNLVVPIIQRRMVYIPPALILLGVVAIGFIFGTVAIVFAAPLIVVAVVMVKKLYLRDGLGQVTSIPGETGAK